MVVPNSLKATLAIKSVSHGSNRGAGNFTCALALKSLELKSLEKS
jgi:hypothetical protein